MSQPRDKDVGAAVLFGAGAGIQGLLSVLTLYHTEWGWAAFSLLLFCVFCIASERAAERVEKRLGGGV